jgi:hypothetical protein
MPLAGTLTLMRLCAVVLGLVVGGCAAPGLSRSRGEPRSIEAATSRPVPRQRIGVVSRREVALDRLEMRLSEARRCPRKSLPAGEGGVVKASAADHAGCRLYAYRGTLPVFAVAEDGEAVEVLSLQASLDGEIELPFARVDATLRATEAGTLDDYQRLLIGTDAWAGEVDLVRLRQFLAQWHFRWVSRGRGSPGLFAVRNPDQPSAREAQQWSVDARLRRQDKDFRQVEAGEMSPETFLERHIWSPYRDAVIRALTGRGPTTGD